MGIGFAKKKHYDFGWSYRGFHHFRTRLAKEIGLNLDEMGGFGGTYDWPENEPIVLLLNHSDYKGNIYSTNCEKIYPRLLELITKWPDEDYDKIHATKLAEAMKECALEVCDLEFV